VGAARGAIVLFLDDDDLLLAGYPQRVLAAAAGPAAPAFGFCATTRIDAAAGPAPFPARRPFADGMLPASSPLRHRLIAFSAGFWIRRDLYLELGGCDTSLTVDEDTEFCCRLAALGLPPWFDAQPGISLRSAPDHRDRLTRSTPPEVVVACYRQTWERHGDGFPPWSEARWHLATRFIRRAVREGRPKDARATLRAVRPPGFRAALWAFFHTKRLTAALRRG
jgi:hypothetical protein